MGLPYGIQKGGDLTFEESVLILNKAYEAGINELDTAEAYGNAHTVIGKYHDLHPERKFKVITKLPKNIEGDIEAKVIEYLSELKVDQLEAIMFHAYETLKHNPNALSILSKLKSQGLINNIGVSIYTNEEFESLLNYDEVDLIQLPFNLFDNESCRGDLLEEAKQKGKTIHTRSAFLQGLFFMHPSEQIKIVEILKSDLLIIRQLAEDYNLSLASLALNYCLQNEKIDKVLIGVDSMDQLKQNLSITGQSLSEELINRINNIIIKNRNLLNPALWK